MQLKASGKDFRYDLHLTSSKPLVLQGEQGYSQKSEAGQASYYYSQPFFDAKGSVVIEGKTYQVTGNAWLDREWSSQPLTANQSGWDWFSHVFAFSVANFRTDMKKALRPTGSFRAS